MRFVSQMAETGKNVWGNLCCRTADGLRYGIEILRMIFVCEFALKGQIAVPSC